MVIDAEMLEFWVCFDAGNQAKPPFEQYEIQLKDVVQVCGVPNLGQIDDMSWSCLWLYHVKQARSNMYSS